MNYMAALTILNALSLRGKAGTETVFLNYTHMLASLGYRVICCIPKRAAILEELTALKNVKIIEDDGMYLNKGKFNPLQIFKIRKILANDGVKAVFVHSGGLVKLFRYATYRLCPLIAVNHGTNVKQLAKADFIIAATHKYEKELIEEGVSSERILYLPHVISLSTEELVRNKRNPKGVLVLGCLGRLEENKGIEFLIDAVQILRSRNVKVNLLIAGEGKEETALRNQVEKLHLTDCVKFIGWVNDKAKFFKEINIFCLPTRLESFGLVLLEAMMYRVPVVTTNTEGPSELIKDGVTGLIVPPGCSKSLALQIEMLMKNTQLQSKLVKNAYLEFLDTYTPKAVGPKLEQALKKWIK